MTEEDKKKEKEEELAAREERFVQQRKERGWDDSETWSLDFSFAKWIVPRLKRFKELTFCYPVDLTPEQWDNMLDHMIEGFQIIIDEDGGQWLKDEKQHKVQCALKLFHDRFFDLWW